MAASEIELATNGILLAPYHKPLGFLDRYHHSAGHYAYEISTSIASCRELCSIVPTQSTTIVESANVIG
jgi:hypothetical protein